MKKIAMLFLLVGAGCSSAHIRGSIDIAREPEAVFSMIADQRNEPRYNPEMVAVELLTPEPVTAGSRFAVQMRSRGELIPMTVAYTEFLRPRRLSSFTTTDDMDISGTLTCTPALGGTRLAWEWQLQPKGWLVLAGPLIGMMGATQEKRIWTSLKQLLEATPTTANPATAATTTSPARP